MTLDQIAGHIAKTVGITKKQGEEAYKALVELIKTEANYESNTKVSLPKLGNLTIKAKEAYMGKNPRTNEAMMIGPMRKVTFAAYDSLKESLNSILPPKAVQAK